MGSGKRSASGAVLTVVAPEPSNIEELRTAGVRADQEIVQRQDRRDDPVRQLLGRVRAGVSAVSIRTTEERRALTMLAHVAFQRTARLLVWRESKGYTEILVPDARTMPLDAVRAAFERGLDEVPCVDLGDPERMESARMALEEICKRVYEAPAVGAAAAQTTLVAFCDLHPSYTDPKVVRMVRDLAERASRSNYRFFILDAGMPLPAEWDTQVESFDLPLPGEVPLRRVIRQTLAATAGDSTTCCVETDVLDNETMDRLTDSLKGLTLHEAENALALGLIDAYEATGAPLPQVDATVIPHVLTAKRSALRGVEGLSYEKPTVTMDALGEMGSFKRWARQRRRALYRDAREFGVDAPKGALFVGPPGTGKSVAVYALGDSWGVPVLRLDFGAIFNSSLGQSERNIRTILARAKALAPCIVFGDEMEKGFAGTGSSDKTDGGTMARVFGTVLTWMAENETPVFMAFTSNNAEAVPPELLRPGRLDAKWAVMPPCTPEGRLDILNIHLRKRRRDPRQFEGLDALAQHCEGFTQAEMEQIVKDALVIAFDEREASGDPSLDLDMEHLTQAAGQITPACRTVEGKSSLDAFNTMIANGVYRHASVIGTP